MDFRQHPIKREIEIEGFHSIYYFEFDKDFYYLPEKYDFWVMTYCDMGKIISIADGVAQTVEQGQLVFNPPNEVHAHVSNKVDPNNMLIVAFSCHSPAMEFFEHKTFTLGKTEKTLLSLFAKTAREALGKLPGDYYNRDPLDFTDAPAGTMQLLECYLTELLLLLLRGGDEASYSTPLAGEASRELVQSSLAEMIVSYLRENVRNTVTLSDLCDRFFMGKSGLYKLFDEHLGQSPMEYFAALKIAEAKRLLRHGELSVGAISDMLSYSSIHNFSRAFKNATGVSPMDYRKKSVHREE
ncbi:MAG: helix-turn-helix domain-containing protein [Clostridia bacterium]|nr:helix-turn-helix domain-containing protein [Clostridia bacterium]